MELSILILIALFVSFGLGWWARGEHDKPPTRIEAVPYKLEGPDRCTSAAEYARLHRLTSETTRNLLDPIPPYTRTGIESVRQVHEAKLARNKEIRHRNLRALHGFEDTEAREFTTRQ